MPHSRTRIWVGAAIIAVTIPAVGTYYTQASAADDLRGRPISVASQMDLTNRTQDSIGSRRFGPGRPLRNYQAEVDAAPARQGGDLNRNFAEDDLSNDDDSFDADPLMDGLINRYGSSSDVTDPVALLTSQDPNPVAYSTDGPVTSGRDSGVVAASLPTTAPPSNQEAMPDDATPNISADASGTGTLSDSDVYRLVVRNLAPGPRDDFVRSYATMSADQRADLLNGFRQQLQSGP